ncbi:antitoxin [Humibacillus xanthopallidus]|uniref:antitoxin n=1 Tax=Humibacillus xanthopallidus TaxID=412689 RepID=UPI00384F86DF
MSFLDKMKKKAEELELDKKAKDLQAAATTAAKQAREKAGDYTAENRSKIDGYVEKAATTIDTKTDGKYADKVAKAKEQVGKGVDKVAEGSPNATGAPGTAPTTGPPMGTPMGSPVVEPDSAAAPTFPVDPDAPQPPPPGAPGATPPRPHGM